MALINLLRDITLISFLEWEAWDKVLKIKAKRSNLWGYINPSTYGKRLLKRPIKPEVSDFPKNIYNSR